MNYFDTSHVTLVNTSPIPPPVVANTLWAKIKREFKLYKKLFNDPCGFQSNKYNHLKSVRYLGKTVLFLFILLLLITSIYVTGYRANGDDWTYKKLFLYILLVLIILFMVISLLWCFVNPDFTYIGYTHLQCDKGTHIGTILIVLS